jgi:hypothetical protein
MPVAFTHLGFTFSANRCRAEVLEEPCSGKDAQQIHYERLRVLTWKLQEAY